MIKRKLGEIKNKTTKNTLRYLQTKESSEVLTEIKKVVAIGGKGVRAAIFYQGYFACGGEDKVLAVNCASALELFHNFALIHDDIIDNSSLRRGNLSVVQKVGFSKAILVGDYSYILANELFYKALLSTKLKPFLIKKAQAVWQKLQEEVLLGQYQDVSLNFWDYLKQENHLDLKLKNIEKTVWQIMELKTASYSIVRPLLLVTALTNQTSELAESFSAYGKYLGLAFQIYDDILGMFGEEKVVGKPVDSDLKEGKMTLLMVKFLTKVSIDKINIQNISNIDWVRNQFTSLGVLDECKDIASTLISKAKITINNSSLLKKDKLFFNELADFVVEREN